MTTPYAVLLLTGGLSALASWLDFVAILTFASYIYGTDGYGMALIGVVSLAPGILLARAVGRWCDRADARRALRLSLVVRALSTAALCLPLGYVAFVVLVAFRSTAAAVSPIALNVVAARQLRSDRLHAYFAHQNLVGNLSKIACPALGALLARQFGDVAALVAASALCWAGWVLCMAIRADSGSGSMREWAATEVTRKVERAAVGPIVAPVALLFGSVFLVNNQVPLILNRAGFDPSTFAAILTCSALGNVLSASVSAWGRQPGQPTYTSALLLPAVVQLASIVWVAWLLARDVPTIHLIGLAFFMAGLASARFAILTAWIVGETCRAHVGQAFAEIQRWQGIMMLVAPAIGAWILETYGSIALLAGAGLAGIVLMFGWRLTASHPRRVAN